MVQKIAQCNISAHYFLGLWFLELFEFWLLSCLLIFFWPSDFTFSFQTSVFSLSQFLSIPCQATLTYSFDSMSLLHIFLIKVFICTSYLSFLPWKCFTVFSCLPGLIISMPYRFDLALKLKCGLLWKVEFQWTDNEWDEHWK